MAYNFLRGDRDQPFLLPPDLRDWLPANHLAWFVHDVVDQLDLGPFLRSYRADGHGHPAYDPKTLLGVLLYAYAVGVRSSRQIQRRCREDLAFRVLSGNQTPHQQALAGFLVESLKLCAAAGLVRLGLVALDGTKVAANAATRANRTLVKLQEEVAQILQEAAETDQAEDRQHGLTRGDELPAELASPSGRLARLRVAQARLEAEAAERQRRYQQRVADLAAAARARGRKPRAHIKPRRRDEAPNPGAVANTTDPDSRLAPTRKGTVQGYNAQAVVTEHQVVVAAALTQQANDLQQLTPMLQAADQTLAAADIHQRPGRLLADSGYWSIANLTAIPDAPDLYIPPARHGRQGKPRKDGKPSASKSDGLRAAMVAKLGSDQGKACYAKRKRPWNRSSGSSRNSRAPAGSPAAGWLPATPSGSCCVAPTTSSSSGATPTVDRHPHRPPPEQRPTPPRAPRRPTPTAAPPDRQTRPWPARRSNSLAAAMERSPFGNML